MTTHILFVQGGGADVHDGWDHKLVASLEHALGAGYRVHYPRMPDEADPQYAAWRPALQRALAALPDGAILVGHSVGGTQLIHVLAEQIVGVPAALFLLSAPFIGDGGWPSEAPAPRTDFGDRLAGLPVFLYHGSADDTVPPAHVQLYAKTLPHATVRVLTGRDHQLGDDLTEVAHDIRALRTTGPDRD